jgi:hypothetical protein
MAHEAEVDTENQRVAADEETPLLNEGLTEQEGEADPKELEPSRVGWWAWRIFWTIVAALVLAVFIKGWIDAGSDVNVCLNFGDACIQGQLTLNLVRLEGNSQSCSWRWFERCGVYGPASPVADGMNHFSLLLDTIGLNVLATSNDYELPIPFWDFLYCCNEDSV